jgi:hypothetical protein
VQWCRALSAVAVKTGCDQIIKIVRAAINHGLDVIHFKRDAF